ncbi:MAG TPA: alkaline phosphatase D family protein [Rhizobacter sp.]|nr:alkaline phosphatase D family protein [Rhizobacter sp.]
MKIAFTSCMDTVNYPTQPGWAALAREKPTHVVLLGDSIYMDYGKKIFGAFVSGGPRPESEANGTPARLPLDVFSTRMHQRYEQQYKVPGFLDAIRGRKVHAIWDDHDFAWNNSRGAGPAGPAFVPQAQRRISTAHYRAWQAALAAQKPGYPPNDVDSAAPPHDDAGIGRTEMLADGVCLHLLDSRTFREGDEDAEDVSLLGQAQRDKVEAALAAHAQAVHIVAVSEPMEKWNNFTEFKWLVDWATRRHILVICGDIHDCHYVGYKPNGKKDWGAKDKAVLHEFAASAMAQGPTVFGKKKEVFGTLDFSDTAIAVTLFHEGQPVERYAIDRNSWKISNI